MSNQMDLTIDVCVLRSGSNTGNPKYFKASFDLMDRMAREGSYLLCLDSRKKIEHQYSKQLKQGTFGHQWLTLMANKNKIAPVKWQQLDRGTKSALKEAHFDSSVGEDYKYVITAAGSQSHVLVSHDPDYSNRVRRILNKRLSISVKTAGDA